MEVFLIRHTTPSIAKDVIYGRTDVLLADSFEEEKEKVLQKIPEAFDRVYTSPSARCSKLAQCIAENTVIDDRLYEVNFGLWEGKTWSAIEPAEISPWMNDYVNCCPPGGESMIQMNDRVMSFWNMLKQQHRDQKIAIVTHGGVIRLILANLNNIPLISLFNIEVAYGAVFHVHI